MISGRQIRAARGLLGWDASTLANNASMTKETIYRIESDTVHPQEKTLAKIIRVFDLYGVEFTESEGVKIRQNQIRVFQGKDGYRQFLDHIYENMKGGGTIRQFNISDATLSYADSYAEIHKKRMADIGNLDAKVLMPEEDIATITPYCQYKYLNKSNSLLIPFYVYNDYMAQSVAEENKNIEIVSIHSKLLSNRYMRQFDLFWETALPLVV